LDRLLDPAVSGDERQQSPLAGKHEARRRTSAPAGREQPGQPAGRGDVGLVGDHDVGEFTVAGSKRRLPIGEVTALDRPGVQPHGRCDRGELGRGAGAEWAAEHGHAAGPRDAGGDLRQGRMLRVGEFDGRCGCGHRESPVS
jgi:hypothetical protein